MKPIERLLRFLAETLGREVMLGGALRVIAVAAATTAMRSAADEIDRLKARRPVVCETCWSLDEASEDCPDCGKDGCGPGVRWSE